MPHEPPLYPSSDQTVILRVPYPLCTLEYELDRPDLFHQVGWNSGMIFKPCYQIAGQIRVVAAERLLSCTSHDIGLRDRLSKTNEEVDDPHGVS